MEQVVEVPVSDRVRHLAQQAYHWHNDYRDNYDEVSILIDMLIDEGQEILANKLSVCRYISMTGRCIRCAVLHRLATSTTYEVAAEIVKKHPTMEEWLGENKR